jgi:PAS domain S-box-containing protein
MMPAPLPPDESDRLQSVRALGLLDTPAEERFDRIARLARSLLGAPIALISLIDEKRQWFKSRQGLSDASQTPRAVSLCAHAILGPDIFEVPDTALDERFRDNPLVVGGPRARFYAGVPIAAPDGRRVGTLCVIDCKPRRLTEDESRSLKDLAVLVENELAATTLGRALARSLAFERKFQRKRRVRAKNSMSWKITAGFVAGAFMTLVLAILSYRTASGFVAAERRSGRGHDVLADADAVVELVQRQTSLPRAETRALIASRLEHLRTVLSGDAGQLAGADRLAAAAMRAPARGAAEAAAAARDEIDRFERDRLAERRARADAGSVRLILVVAVGGGVAVLVVLLSGAFILRDFSSRERAEEETAWLNARLRAVLDSAKQVAIIGTDLGGTITVFNTGAERMFGYASSEVIGRLTPATFLRADGVAAHVRELSRRLGREISPEHSVFETARAGGEFEWTCWRKDGEPLIVAVTMTGLMHDGKLAGALAIGRDVTAQRRAEAEAAAAAERLRAVFDASTEVGIIVSDAEGIIRLFNVGAERLVGWSAAEVVDRFKAVVFHDPAEVEARRAELTRKLGRAPEDSQLFAFGIADGGTDDREWTFVRRDGARVPVRVVMTGIRGAGGRLEGFLEVISDVREQRRAREEMMRARDLALSAAEAKSRFVANVSHEIRTPMNAILGLSGLLVDESSDPRQREQLETVRGAADALLALINDLLDFSKMEAGKMRLEEQDFDPREVVARAVELFAARARGKGLALSVEAAPDLPAALRGDPGRLRQILLNLVGNAVKFTEKGSVRVFLAAAPDGMRVEVIDTGIGIPAESFSRLFQSFSQVDGSTTRRYEGTGLGLAISRQLVELMRGRIGAVSEPGRGSTFWFEVPLTRGRPPAREEDAASVPAGSGRRLRVLVVEDNSVNQKVLLMLLRRLGHAAEAVAGGREALETLAAIRYDVVLMDCQMPDMDGYETTRELRRRQAPGVPRTPVVALTANALPEDRRRCFEAGMDDFLAKPVRIEDISRVLMERVRAPLDPAAVGRFRELVGEQSFVEVRLEFLRSAGELIGAMAEADRRDDAAGVARAAHTLKGASASIGADGLEALCARACALQPDERGLRWELIFRMRSELEAVRSSPI